MRLRSKHTCIIKVFYKYKLCFSIIIGLHVEHIPLFVTAMEHFTGENNPNPKIQTSHVLICFAFANL